MYHQYTAELNIPVIIQMPRNNPIKVYLKMKKSFLFCFMLMSTLFMYAQDAQADQKNIAVLIDSYSLAREKSDTVLLKSILTGDVDQLVSTGEWRKGIRSAVDGMLKSSAGNPGRRTLTIANIKLLLSNTAIVDCHYEIQNEDRTMRKMWSTFVVVNDNGKWKIASIRNMLPTGNN
jgi:hypothetical protein